MRECALCNLPARMFCESDRASLCWDCDAKVHGANFLVARHTRCLLCRSCQAPTPWRASGSRLAPTVSVCDKCMAGGCDGRKGESRVESVEVGSGCGADEEEDEIEEDEEMESEEEEEDDEEEEEEEEEEEDGDYQVVPWATSTEGEMEMAPPPVASSSSSDESTSSGNEIHDGFAKRRRGNADLSSSQDDLDFSPSFHRIYHHRASTSAAAYISSADDEATSLGSPSGPSSSSDRRKAASHIQSAARHQAANPLANPYSSGSPRGLRFVSSVSRSPSN